LGEKKYVVSIAYTLSNSLFIIFTGYAGVLQLSSELHITTEMADKFFQRITCELNLTTENANELYQNSKNDRFHAITCNEGKDRG
jgi:hypothetical protein